MQGGILVFNAGSSTVKCSLFSPEPALRYRALFELGSGACLRVRDAEGRTLHEQSYNALDYAQCLGEWLAWLESKGEIHFAAAGHRVVHGGMTFAAPTRIDSRVLQSLQSLVPLAPLHQPHNLNIIMALMQLRPTLPQVACFDTAFHATQADTVRRYGLPRALEAEGIRRYGFHGLSYESIMGKLAAMDAKAARGRIIIAHLGSGASLCAVYEGRSIATTMGFSALDGLVMGTRCGTLDPEIVLYLQREKRMTPAGIETLLYKQSGLLGVSGISADMRVLETNESPHAREAIELFIHRIVREIGGLAACLGGLEGLVFTGGIGENSAQVRRMVCEQLGWLGVELDDAANNGNKTVLSRATSPVHVWAIATDEEAAIARHTRALIP